MIKKESIWNVDVNNFDNKRPNVLPASVKIVVYISVHVHQCNVIDGSQIYHETKKIVICCDYIVTLMLTPQWKIHFNSDNIIVVGFIHLNTWLICSSSCLSWLILILILIASPVVLSAIITVTVSTYWNSFTPWQAAPTGTSPRKYLWLCTLAPLIHNHGQFFGPSPTSQLSAQELYTLLTCRSFCRPIYINNTSNSFP